MVIWPAFRAQRCVTIRAKAIPTTTPSATARTSNSSTFFVEIEPDRVFIQEKPAAECFSFPVIRRLGAHSPGAVEK